MGSKIKNQKPFIRFSFLLSLSSLFFLWILPKKVCRIRTNLWFFSSLICLRASSFCPPLSFPSYFSLAFSTISLPLSRDASTPNFREGGEKYRTKNRRMEETAFTRLHWQRVPFKICHTKKILPKLKNKKK